MMWLTSLFVFGSIGFWILMGLASVALLACTEYEKPVLATLTLAGTLVMLHYFGGYNVLATITANPLTSALWVAAYFVAGTVWSVAKWWFFLRRARDKYEEAKLEFLRRHGESGNKIPDHLLEDWRSRHTVRRNDGNEAIVPKAYENKRRITLWMCYWPWSAVWTIINDPVKRAFREIYRLIQGLLQRMANSAFKSTEDDFRDVPPPAVTPTAAPSDGTTGPAGNGGTFNKGRSSRGLEDRT